MSRPPIITLLTDFGLTDHYVAAMKGVILGICPEARLIDVSHEMAAYGIENAAFTLAQAWPCFPEGTVHLVVVDPGVGSSRRPLLLEANGHYFIAPDNGVLTTVYAASPRIELREITSSRYFREPVSQTFHGRDVFAPVAAHLAAGAPPDLFGKRIEDPVRLEAGGPVMREDGGWEGRIIHIDRFGNLITNFSVSELPDPGSTAFEIRLGEHRAIQYLPNYSSGLPLQLFAIEGSSGYLEVSLNQGDAALLTGSVLGSTVRLFLNQ